MGSCFHCMPWICPQHHRRTMALIAAIPRPRIVRPPRAHIEMARSPLPHIMAVVATTLVATTTTTTIITIVSHHEAGERCHLRLDLLLLAEVGDLVHNYNSQS